MRLSDEFRRLGDHFHEAYEGRVEAVAAIRAEAVEDLAELHTAHQEMSAALRDQLQDAERSRRGEAAEAARHRAGYVDSLRASVASMMNELRSEMEEAHRAWVELGGRMRQARARVALTPPGRAAGREAAVAPPKGRRRKGWART